MVGALLMWLTRQRLTRTHWAISVAVGVVLILVHGLAWLTAPPPIEISTWEPQALFQAQLILRLDRPSMGLSGSIAILLLSVYLTGPARPGSSSPVTRLLGAGYAGLAMVAVMADNLLTVALAWGLADVYAYVFLLPAAEDEEAVLGLTRRFSAQVVSLLLVLGAAMPSLVFAQTVGPGWQSALLAFAVLIRVGLWPLHVGLPPLPGVRRGLGTLVRLMPTAMGLAALDRLLPAEVPLLVRVVLVLLGGLSVALGSLRWVAADDPLRERPFMVLLFAGLGVLASVINPGPGTHAVAAVGCSLLLIGGMISVLVPHEPWHRSLVWVAAILLTGLPWTANHSLASLAASAVGADVVSLIGGILMVGGLSAAAIGAASSRWPVLAPWESGEGFVQGAYGLGLALPLLGVVPVGLLLGGQPATAGLVAALLAIGLFAAGQWVIGRGDQRLLRIGEASTARAAAGLRAAAGFVWRWVGRHVGGASRLVAGVLEGRAGILWVYVVLLAIGLALAGGASGP